jgi:hypothetical protein
MKTPRKILLARHRAAESKLDRMRHDLVAQMSRREATADEPLSARNLPLLAAAALKLWRELILPSRRVWAGLAALWLLLLGVNIGNADKSVTTVDGPREPAQGLRAALERRYQLLEEFAVLPSAKVTVPPIPNPRPRSDRRPETACA